MKFFNFLYWVLKDIRNRPPRRPWGVWVFVGLPGSGKTLSMVEYLERAKLLYPDVKIYTNFGYEKENGLLNDWKQLIDIENGSDGVIFALDEVQDIFGRKGWAKMPDSILSVFAQNRKLAKQFICTSQSFSNVLVDLRRISNFIIECKTWAGRWVWQRAFHSEDYQSDHDGIIRRRIRAWRYSFIATDEIRNLYDTYKVIETIRKEKTFERP